MAQVLNAPILHSVFIRAHPDNVWDALANPDRLNEWFTTDSEGAPTPGSNLVWRWQGWGPEKITTRDVLNVEAARRGSILRFAWHPAGKSHPTEVEITFTVADDGTVVRLREEGYPSTTRGLSACLDCATGWGEALTLLKFYVEHGLTYHSEPRHPRNQEP